MWDFSQGKSHPEKGHPLLLQPAHRQSSSPSLSCSCPGPGALSRCAPTRSAPQTPHSSGSSGFPGLRSQCFCMPQPPLPWEDSSIPSRQTRPLALSLGLPNLLREGLESIQGPAIFPFPITWSRACSSGHPGQGVSACPGPCHATHGCFSRQWCLL